VKKVQALRDRTSVEDFSPKHRNNWQVVLKYERLNTA
jgi:hypothetical protein